MQCRNGWSHTIGLLLAGAGLCACSGDSPGNRDSTTGTGGGGASAGASSGVGGGPALGTGGTIVSIDQTLPPDTDAGSSSGATCSAEVEDSSRLPLDMYFLVDASGSMTEQVQGGTKWQVVSKAMGAFLNDPVNADIGVGLGYFPANVPATCMAGDPDCVCIDIIVAKLCVPLAGGSCTVSDYAKPAVPLSLPPSHGALISSLGQYKPSGGTPTRPALEGAMQYASSWAQSSHRKTVVVLASDGEPTGCTQNSAQDVAAIAAAGLAGPNAIQTFVLGVGRSLGSLNLVAESGGTKKAILVDTGGDVLQAIADALKQIRGQALPCAYNIPARSSKGAIDPRKVNVRYTAKGATAGTLVPMTPGGDPTKCGAAGGWYYDNPNAPAAIQLCPTTCESLADGRVAVEFGCKTIEGEVH